MPELTDNQIADLRVLQHRCAALGADLVIIGAIAYQIHFPAESRHIDVERGTDEGLGTNWGLGTKRGTEVRFLRVLTGA